MKISYVLPIFNEENNIAQCLRSLQKQNIKPHQIIVINDCSTDNSLNIIKEFKDICLLNNESKKGGAYSRNLGNLYATGDIIAVCDADYYYPNRCNAIIEFFEKNLDKDIFYSGLELKNSKNPNDISYMGAIKWDFKSKCPISHPTVAYRIKVIDKVKYKELSLDTDLYEFFLLDCYKEGFNFGGCQEPFMIKIEGNSNRNKENALKLKIKLYKEYGINI